MDIHFNCSNIVVYAIQVDAGGNAYLGRLIGVYYKANGGQWIPFWHKIPVSQVKDLEIYPSAGIIRFSLNLIPQAKACGGITMTLFFSY